MLVSDKNTMPEDIRQTVLDVASELGFSVNFGTPQGRKIRFTIRPKGDQYRAWSVIDRWNSKERRKNAVCVHGHAELFKRLYDVYPNLSLSSNINLPNYKMSNNGVNWKSREDFLDELPMILKYSSIQCKCEE